MNHRKVPVAVPNRALTLLPRSHKWLSGHILFIRLAGSRQAHKPCTERGDNRFLISLTLRRYDAVVTILL